MRKALDQQGRWHGFVVKRKGDQTGKDRVVSGNFETQGGANTFMELAKKSEPTAEFYIAENIKGRA